jgi:uncharacterized protein
VPILSNILESLIHLSFIFTLIYFFRKDSQKDTSLLIGLLVVFYLVNNLVLRLPFYYVELNIFGGQWNWSGKVYAIVWSILFLYIFQNRFQNFVSFQIKLSRRIWVLFCFVILVALVEGILFYFKSWDTETLLFQATMPGIDEEIGFRGIMLGILSTILVSEKQIGRWHIYYPDIWAVSLLFGFVHGFKLSSDLRLTFDGIYFIKTFILGWIWGFMTIKSKSIYLGMLSHNLSNFIPNLMGMLK